MEDLWPDPTTGVIRLFVLASWLTGLVLALRMVRRGAVARRRWREMRRAAVPGVATVVGLREEVTLPDTPVDDGRGALVGGIWSAAFTIALLVAVPIVVAWSR